MNRRNFFKSLSLLAAGLAVSLPGLPSRIRGPVLPALYHKATRTVTINPEWLTASYELGLMHGDSKIMDPYPLRFRNLEDAQAFMDFIGERYGTEVRCKRDSTINISLLKKKSVVLESPVC